MSAINFPFELHTWRDDGWVVSTDPDGSVWLQGDLRYRTILHTHWDAMDLQSNYAEAWDVMVGALLAKNYYVYREPMDRRGDARALLALRTEWTRPPLRVLLPKEACAPMQDPVATQ